MTTPSAPCPEDSTAGVTKANVPTASPPHIGREPAGDAALAEQLLGQRHAAHDGDADQGADHAEGEDRDVVQRLDARRYLQHEIERRVAQSVDHRDRDDGGDRDRGEGAEGVGADHQFEGVECAGQRGVEGAGDGAGGAAANQQAQVVAPDAEHAAEARRHRRADLGIAGLQPDRGADAVRQDRLHHDDQAVVQRHAPAVQRVGLDRVDGASWVITHDYQAEQPDQQAAQCRHRDGADRIEFDHGAEALAGADPEQQLMDQLRGFGHQPHGDAGTATDEGGQHDQPDFVCADQRAQCLRCVQNRIAKGTARSMVPSGRSSPGVRGCRSTRDG